MILGQLSGPLIVSVAAFLLLASQARATNCTEDNVGEEECQAGYRMACAQGENYQGKTFYKWAHVDKKTGAPILGGIGAEYERCSEKGEDRYRRQ